MKKLRQYFYNALNKTNEKSVTLCKFGLEFSFGLILTAIVLTFLGPEVSNFVITQNFIECLIENALGCVFISFFIAIILEAALIDKRENQN